jgi:predicted transcriptional regulator
MTSSKNERKNKNDQWSSKTSPDELKILASTELEPKFIENISRDTQIPLERCRTEVAGLVDLGLLVVDHDSDLYGHEVVKIRRVSKELDT